MSHRAIFSLKRNAFFSQKNLEAHLEIHERSLSCNKCGKEFTTYYSLKNHISEVHEKIKFKCETCGKEYTRQYQLKIHTYQEHGYGKLLHHQTISSAKNL